MKKLIILLSFAVVSVFMFTACADKLETNPTDKGSEDQIFADANSANAAINGAYSLLWRYYWANVNEHQAYGHQSTLFAEDVMAEDVVLMASDFYIFDYYLQYTRQLNIGDGSRNYNVWAMLYEVISNCNYILSHEGEIPGDQTLATSIIAQAYALRAFCYFELVQGFQFTYVGHESAPGVPIYTEPTWAGMPGNPRASVAEVYTRINEDLSDAVKLFEEIDKPVQSHCSNIDYYVAKAFEARVALVQNRWQDAYDAAAAALTRPGVRILNTENELLGGLSEKSLASAMWTMEVISDQKQTYVSIYNALDGLAAYGSRCRKCISSWLYDRIRDEDIRKEWFLDGNQGDAISGLEVNYGQMKRRPYNYDGWQGDYIFLRAEELLLIQAEAAARLSQYGTARALLKELAAPRMTDGGAAYSTYVDGLPDGNAISAAALQDSNTNPANILEEVLLQRRIELWGEIGRIKDLLRLKQGYNRNYSGTNHTNVLSGFNTGPESPNFVFRIPQRELDGNESISGQDPAF